MSNLILSNQQNNVLTITLNRFDKLNALNFDMYNQLISLFKKAETDANIHCIVIQGNAECFCAGNDVRDFVTLKDSDDFVAFDFVKVLASFTKPIIAAIAGPAVGIGTTLLLHCDMVFATNDSKLKLPFTQLGLCPEAGSSYLLSQKLGHNKAFELLVLGDTFTGQSAHEFGIVNQLCSAEDLLASAHSAAERIAKLPIDSVLESRRLLKAGHQDKLNQIIEEEAQSFKKLLSSPMAQRILSAF